MVYTLDDIDKIVEFKTWNQKQKIDELLRIDAGMYCNLGTDSTATERLEVKRNSQKIYRAIKKVDKLLGDIFILDVDKKQ